MRVVIAGAGLVGGEIARKLVKNKHDVTVIEPAKEICDKLYTETGAVIIHGDAAHAEILTDAEVQKADVLVAATGSDADNLACVILSKSMGVGRVVVRMRNEAYESAYKLIGVDSILRVTDIMVNQMIVQIEQPQVRRVTTIGRGKADIFAVTLPKGSLVDSKTVKDIATGAGFPVECVVIASYNQMTNELALPHGDHVVHDGDELFLISSATNIQKAVKVLTATG
jgi:trk system potassium uptake protein TrkA